MLAPDDLALSGQRAAVWPARRFLHWCVLAWRMFRAAPLRLMGLCLLPMAVELVLQVTIPVAGVVASKLLVPVVSAWCLVTTDQRARTGAFAMGAALRRLVALRGALLTVALASACVFVPQALLAWALGGPAAAIGLATGDAAALMALNRAQIACVLASGTVPAMLLFFTVPRMVLDRLSLGAALLENWTALGHGWRPLLAYLTLSMFMVVGLVYQPLLLLLFLPMGYVSYWAYRDVFDVPSAL